MEGGIAEKVNHCSREGQFSKWVLANNWFISELDHLRAFSCLLVIVLPAVNHCSQEGPCTVSSLKIKVTNDNDRSVDGKVVTSPNNSNTPPKKVGEVYFWLW